MVASVVNFGFKPIRHIQGGTVRTRNFPISGSNNTAIYYGDVVKLSSGNVVVAGSSDTEVLGVFMGCFGTDTSNFGMPRFSMYWPGGSAWNSPTDAYAIVACDPGIVFQVCTDGVTQSVASWVGKNAAIVTSTAGVARTGVSGMVLNSTTGTSAAMFKIIGKVDVPQNQWGDQAILLETVINTSYSLFSNSSGL
jgi:hypothetical protein